MLVLTGKCRRNSTSFVWQENNRIFQFPGVVYWRKNQSTPITYAQLCETKFLETRIVDKCEIYSTRFRTYTLHCLQGDILSNTPSAESLLKHVLVHSSSVLISIEKSNFRGFSVFCIEVLFLNVPNERGNSKRKSQQNSRNDWRTQRKLIVGKLSKFGKF